MVTRTEKKPEQIKLRRPEKQRAPVRGKGSALIELQKEIGALRKQVEVLWRDHEEQLAAEMLEREAWEEEIKDLTSTKGAK